MPLLFKQLKYLAKPFAHVAKFSAKHPIHVILITLLFAASTYLSVIEHYFNGWSVDSRPSFSNAGFSSYNPLEHECLHYHYQPSTSNWSELSSEELEKLKYQSTSVEHYYLLQLEFSSSNKSLALPMLEGSINQNGSTEYLLKHELSIDKIIKADDGTEWTLRAHRYKLNDIKTAVLSAYQELQNRITSAEPFDIFIVGSAYAAMMYTLISLFFDMRVTGSRFWIALAAIVNSGTAFFIALYTSQKICNRPVTALSLIEGVPFVVVIVGFKHKIKLAKYVVDQFNRFDVSKKLTTYQVVYDAVIHEGSRLVQDHLLCIIAFGGCALYAASLTALSNFCFFCALLLSFDLLLTSTFFAAVLALKLEINIIHRATTIKQTLEEDGVVPSTAGIISDSETLKKNRVLRSSTPLTLGKIFFVAGFICFNIYNFSARWTYETFASLYQRNNDSGLPGFLSSTFGEKNDVIVSVVPVQFYEPSKAYFQVEDGLLSFVRYISIAIRDRFISKVLIFALVISASINVYLLNAARIHTEFTANDVRKQRASKRSSKSAIAHNELPSPSSSASNETKVEVNSHRLPEVVSDHESEEYTESDSDSEGSSRPLNELVEVMKSGEVQSLRNKEVVSLVVNNKLPLYALEKQLGDTTRAVVVRRKALSVLADAPVLATERLPYKHYDYDRVFGACCENVIGYMPLPVGVIGPLMIDNVYYHIPMATTEGCLVASAMRGCKAINAGGGVTTVLTKDGMTRGPCVRFPSLARAGACKIWLDSEEGQNKIKKAFNSTSRFARLQHIQTAIAGDLLFIRFRTTTGDAMGMNMISKGVEFSLNQMVDELGWDDMEIVSVSGNYCIDKKPAAINWIEGRGKSVVAEATIPGEVVRKVLKSDVHALVDLNISKNLIGSAMAGSVGGFNAQASNLVTAVYLALGQDPAQNVESSNCITLMKEVNGDLRISVSMPSIEVGTIGGGTVLEPQGAMLDLLGVRGPHPTEPGTNARQLAKIVASAVMAGELSLCGALAAGHLVQSHMIHNRAKQPTATPTAATTAADVSKNLTPQQLQTLKEGSVTCIKS